MPAYVLFVMNRLDENSGEAALAEYRNLGRPARLKYGGEVRVVQEFYKNAPVENAEGQWSPMAVILTEFESMEKAKEFYYSPEYQAAFRERQKASEFTVSFLQGT